MKYCPHCGQLIRSDAVICPYCGYQQSRTSRDGQNPDRPTQNEPDQSEPTESREDYEADRPDQIKYSRARLTLLDLLTLAFTVFNAATLLFLGCQGLLRPYYINNIGTFVTVVFSLVSIVLLCFEIHQNRKNRLPNLAAAVSLVGSVSVFVLIFLFNQRYLLFSAVLIVFALYLFDRELHKIY